jgi:hypothetical protein
MTARGIPHPMRRVLRYELSMWLSLYRWLFRRPGPAGQAFSYFRTLAPVMWAFIVVGAIEIPAVHLLLPWPVAERIALVAGIYGLLWMVGMMASNRVNPHTVDDDGLHVRLGGTVHLLVPWETIEAVRIRRRPYEGARSIRIEDVGEQRVLAVVVGGQTTLDVVLSRPLPLPGFRGDPDPVEGLRLFADDDKALAATLRAGLAERRPAPEPR